MTAQEKARLKGEGFISQRQSGYFTVRVPSQSGNFTAEQCQAMAEIANTYGHGYMGLTMRMSIEIPWIQPESIDAVKAALANAGLFNGGTGKRVRPCVACKGTICVHGQYDTQGLSAQVAAVWQASAAPSKLKINLAGCPNNCTKVQVNDIGVIGRTYPTLDADDCVNCGACVAVCPAKALALENGRAIWSEKCVGCGKCIPVCPRRCFAVRDAGVEIYLGGVGGRTMRMGESIGVYPTERLPDILGNVLTWYRTEGKDGERLGQTIARLGLDTARALAE